MCYCSNFTVDIVIIVIYNYFTVQCIDYDFKGLQDPTYYVLLTYVQSPEATMDKIFSALQKMQRFDIINQIKDYVYDLINVLSQYATNEGKIDNSDEFLF